MTEREFIAALRALPLHPGARGLFDDSALIDAGPVVITTDTLVEGVHYLLDDPPGDVAWKLVAVNLSDLAAKGAKAEGVLLNYPLGDDAWDRAFVYGLGKALDAFACPLIGGDTVALPSGAPRILTITAIGSDARAPARSGAMPGDGLWVTGTIGNAAAGLAIARGTNGPAELLTAYRRPSPRMREGRTLAPLVRAMMDVSDGLLIDTGRMADASECAFVVDLACVPISDSLRAFSGDDRAARMAAMTGGDDYELLFTLPAGVAPPVAASLVGSASEGRGLSLVDGGEPVALPPRLGFEHGRRG